MGNNTRADALSRVRMNCHRRKSASLFHGRGEKEKKTKRKKNQLPDKSGRSRFVIRREEELCFVMLTINKRGIVPFIPPSPSSLPLIFSILSNRNTWNRCIYIYSIVYVIRCKTYKEINDRRSLLQFNNNN